MKKNNYISINLKKILSNNELDKLNIIKEYKLQKINSTRPPSAYRHNFSNKIIIQEALQLYIKKEGCKIDNKNKDKKN